ncbi:MAG: MoxR family ATPase [Bacteroidota bacterium]
MATFDFEIPAIGELKKKYNDPKNYILSEELVSAVKVAMHLNQPLFLTGKPGTGKTQLAFKIAYEYGLKDDEGKIRPMIFNTKTTSTAQDLFYTYDAVRHFRDANLKDGPRKPTQDYIKLSALGKAIALTNPQALAGTGLLPAGTQPQNSVVLIDEVDKAPTDFPNDILYEIEHKSFEIKELGLRVEAGVEHRPIIILTSNSEKNLPEAFLRRCVFFHIPFPNTNQLVEIVQKHLGETSAYASDQLIQHFESVRKTVRKKQPATAELIGWLRMLELENFLRDGLNMSTLSEPQKQILRFSYTALAKDKDDLQRLIDTYTK